MIKGPKDELDQIILTHVCPEHGPKLVVAWDATESSYVIRCAEGHLPEEVTRQKSRTEQFQAGELAPVGEGLSLLQRTDADTREALSPAQIDALIDYAIKYGLSAYCGHVMIMHGEPYITLDGRLYYAHKQGIPYQLRSRPLDESEKKTYLIEEDDHAWICEVILPLTNQSFTGLGTVTQKEMMAMSAKNPTHHRYPVVAAHPWQLAQKRAEWQALRRAFPIGESEREKDI